MRGLGFITAATGTSKSDCARLGRLPKAQHIPGFIQLQMSDLSSKQHARRAAFLLGLGAALAIVPAVGMYFDANRSMAWVWILSLVATIPAIGWGSSHLALSRGYSTGAGCGLCIVGYVISGFLGTTSPHPLALGVGVLFILLLPTVVLLALPNKSGHSRRKRNSRHR